MSIIAKSTATGRSIGVPIWLILLASLTTPAVAETDDAQRIIAAFAATSEGYSTDELLIRDDLRDRFLIAISDSGEKPGRAREREVLLRLLQLRKAGKLPVRATRRGRPVEDSVLPVAEIAARVVGDRHRITSDTMLADPQYRRELQQEAQLLAAEIDPYQIRKAVLSLRKKRALRPELVLQVADWPRTVQTLTLDQLRSRLAAGRIAKQPGIYLFRDSKGYLYIGEAGDLSERLTTHVLESDRPSLAEFLAGDRRHEVTVELHIFPADSPARKVTVRRAYESELIRSRRPRFNVRP